MSGGGVESDVAALAERILKDAVEKSKSPELRANTEFAVTEASAWLSYISAKRVESLNNRMVRWTAAAATLSLITLIILLLRIR